MLELLLCSMLTHPPRLPLPALCAGQAVRQGNHPLLGLVRAALGHHGCLMLTVGLITVVFYNHPSTTTSTSFYFRTIPILPEGVGRVPKSMSA